MPRTWNRIYSFVLLYLWINNSLVLLWPALELEYCLWLFHSHTSFRFCLCNFIGIARVNKVDWQSRQCFLEKESLQEILFSRKLVYFWAGSRFNRTYRIRIIQRAYVRFGTAWYNFKMPLHCEFKRNMYYISVLGICCRYAFQEKSM